MKNLRHEQVLQVKHWNPGLFSFFTTRDPGLRFENGQFIMLGLEDDPKPLMRAYSFASANWEEQLEFFSIKVPDGPLTSRLQHLKEGDEILLSSKPTGTLLIHDLHPGPGSTSSLPAPALPPSCRSSKTRKPTSASTT